MFDFEYQKQEAAARGRYQARAAARAHTLQVLETASPLSAESDERKRVRLSTIDPHDGLALERLIGASDLLPLAYLEAGLICARPVCRVEVHDRRGRVLGYGTGFMVAPELMLTNNHVLHDAQTALYSLAQFDYENDLRMQPRPTRNFRLEPERLFITDETLDFSLVAVAPVAAEGVRLEQYGHTRLIASSGKALLGECVSIIQHPSGAPKAVAIRSNQVTDVFDEFIHYSTDTEPGSSGSPVLSDAWEVVALHHAGVPGPAGKGYVANEGIRISSIMAHLAALSDTLPAAQQTVLRSLLDHQPALPAPGGMEVVTLERSAYAGLAGYEDHFLGEEYRIPLPVLGESIRGDLAEVPGEEGGVLRYAHFSIVMNRARKLAFYTAVNIDGAKLKQIPRSGDKWYFDPRIDRDLQSGPELYANNDLDRGHLVRRLDPVWGRDAARANEDTFHFTNASPQHRNLNQQTWLNLENYILDNAGRHDLKVTVFTGPVFRDDDMLYRGRYRIPAEFWKVVAMVRPDGALSATAYLQTQKNLLDDLEFAYGKYKTYQVPVERIEHLTDLDFGSLRGADPLGGQEAGFAGIVIEGPQDIRLGR
ncbi:MAG: DNA/RNA non-specific endonuclease [Pseudomonadota bacterium]